MEGVIFVIVGILFYLTIAVSVGFAIVYGAVTLLNRRRR